LRWLRVLVNSPASRVGSSRRPKSTKNSTPPTRAAPPTGRKSNSWNRKSPCSASDALTRRFGGVPIWVVRPPSKHPNDSGISSREAGTRARRASPITTGSISTATPMLFMNADSPPEASMITATSAASLRPATRMR